MHQRKLHGLALVGFFGGVAFTGEAKALPPIPVPGGHTIEIDSEAADRSGFDTVSGDINDDGADDLLVAGPVGAGIVRAYFGPKAPGELKEGDAEFVGLGGTELGWAMTLADLNADGIDDVVVAAPSERATWENGVIYGFYGPISAATYDVTQADVAIEAPTSTGRYFGWSLTTGDFNCDGQDDIAVGDQNDTPSVTHIIFETNAGRYELGTQGTDYTVINGEAFAGAALAAGDFNGDGCDELAIGAYGNAGYAQADFGGAAYMMYGRTTWDPAYELRGADSDDLKSMSTAVFHDLDRGENVGFSLAFGDHHGDGFDDLIIGAPFRECQGCGSTWRRAGRVFVVEGRMDGVAGGAMTPVLLGEHDLRQTSKVVGFQGDADGDLYGLDVAYVGLHWGGLHGVFGVGAPGVGKAYLERLPFGAPGGDCNLDPYVYDEDCDVENGGVFHMVQRSGDGLQRYDHADVSSRFGYSIAPSRIAGGNDIVIGAPFSMSFNHDPTGNGRTYVFAGASGPSWP